MTASRRQILCAVDFSDASYQAISRGSLIAQLIQADLTLVHAIHVLPQTFGVLRQQDSQSQALMADAQERARTLLREAKQAHVPYAVTSKSIVQAGSWKDIMLATAMEKDPYLVIIPPTQTFSREDYQSLSQYLGCPMLVFPYDESKPANSHIRKLLLVGDSTSLIERWGDLVQTVFSLMSTEVYLVATTPAGTGVREHEIIRRNTETCCHKLEEAGFSKVQFQLIAGEPDPIRLQEIGLQMGCDLILQVPTEAGTRASAERLTSVSEGEG